MQHALLFSRSILGAGIQSALERLPDWSVFHATTQCPEQMVDLAARQSPTVTLFDLASMPVGVLFQSLGQKQVKEVFQVMVAACFPHSNYLPPPLKS